MILCEIVYINKKIKINTVPCFLLANSIKNG